MKNINQKGVTLIALVITIIVIVILVGITINAVVGDHGIISETKQAKDDYYSAENAEQQTLDSAVSAIRRAKIEAGMISSGSGSQSGQNENTEVNTNTESGNNSNTIANETNGGSVSQDDPVEPITQNTGTIGTATNLSKYGWKVQGYTAGDLVWRLFYEDENNVYIISEAQDGSASIKNVSLVQGHYFDDDYSTPTGVWHDDWSDYSPKYSKYVSGESVSQQGKNIMPLATGIASTSYGTNSDRLNIFTSSNIYPSIWGVAYMCDTAEWTQYKQGNASWAMGGPSLELFVASYNATHTRQINLTLDSDDGEYYYDLSVNTYGAGENHGIYGGRTTVQDSSWWLASVYYATSSYFVSESYQYSNVYDLRKFRLFI